MKIIPSSLKYFSYFSRLTAASSIYSILFYSILFYSVLLFCSVLFYSILFYSHAALLQHNGFDSPDEGLTLKPSAFNCFSVASLPYQLDLQIQIFVHCNTMFDKLRFLFCNIRVVFELWLSHSEFSLKQKFSRIPCVTWYNISDMTIYF